MGGRQQPGNGGRDGVGLGSALGGGKSLSLAIFRLIKSGNDPQALLKRSN